MNRFFNRWVLLAMVSGLSSHAGTNDVPSLPAKIAPSVTAGFPSDEPTVPQLLPISAPAEPAVQAATIPPEALLTQIEAELGSMPDTEIRAQRFPELRDRFLSLHPQHPGRWQLRFTEAVLAAQNEESEQQLVAERILKEIQEAPDSPAALKVKCSGFALIFDYQLFLRKRCTAKFFEEKISHHLKKHPQAENNSIYAQWLLEAAAANAGTNRARVLESFVRSSVPHVADAARQKLAVLRRLNDLRKTPLALRFTSVDGKEVDLATLRGKVVLVDFWATWCVECLALIPGRVQAYRALKDRGFEIVGISFDEDKQALLDTLSSRQVTWPHYYDGKAWGNAFATQYGIEGLPMSWLINRQGLLVGTDILTGLEHEVQKLLDH